MLAWSDVMVQEDLVVVVEVVEMVTMAAVEVTAALEKVFLCIHSLLLKHLGK